MPFFFDASPSSSYRYSCRTYSGIVATAEYIDTTGTVPKFRTREGDPLMFKTPYFWKKLHEPVYFQGGRRRKRYFEGWYYKVVFETCSYAFIPGVSYAENDAHAFVQVLDGSRGTSQYHRFEIEEFSSTRDEFGVTIGRNVFALDRFSIDLPSLSADFSVTEPILWKSRSFFSPGTMGWYSFVPFMQCKHGIIVLDAGVDGTINGEPMSGGRFYLEKDYGVSFPRAWVWIQSNNFDRPACSFSCSIATIPFAGGGFTGFLCGVLIDGELYRFTTYTGAHVRAITISSRELDVLIKSGDLALHVRVERRDGADLASPDVGAMKGRVNETLESRVHVTVTQKGRAIFEGVGENAGLEVVHPELLRIK
ncbi:MAG: hypothetical protein EA426_06350 [Spirochaetaceae bacterium]|nr:MAG: hypothetical protein EA426_06350 [Spirochaetaceae bacterium]